MKFILLILIFFSMLTGNAMALEKNVYGYVEKVTLVDKNLTVSAKLDTGAKSSSLHAINVESIMVDGVEYLRFVVPGKEGNVTFQSEYIGKVRIKMRVDEHANLANKAEKINRRPIVLMRVQMGELTRTIPVNLTNRKRFLYPLLLGRNAINAFSGLVDPSTVFTIKSNHVVKKNEVK